MSGPVYWNVRNFIGILFGSFRYRSPLKSVGIFLGTCEMSNQVTDNVLLLAFEV